MLEVVVLVRKGPLAGREMRLELGEVPIGRTPGPRGLTLTGDDTVSRLQGKLSLEESEVVYQNASANGTVVNGKLETDRVVLEPGARLRMGSEYLLEVQFRQPRRSPERDEEAGTGGLLSRGPLARPLVRVVLALYLLGVVALAVLLGRSGDRSVVERFAPVRESYLSKYDPAGLSREEREARLARAEEVVRTIQVLERAESWAELRRAYRELMAIDGDPQSPFYRFAAKRLGALANKR